MTAKGRHAIKRLRSDLTPRAASPIIPSSPVATPTGDLPPMQQTEFAARDCRILAAFAAGRTSRRAGRSVETLIRRLDNRLRFGRNYETGMRPYAAYCEEEIWLAE